MPRRHDGLMPFQENTVAWALKMLKQPGGGPRRFLVADEVGLGKTKIAAGVIRGLCAAQGTRLTVIYVASSTDICHQNRNNLVTENEDYRYTDRICLLWKNRSTRTWPRLIALTPGTSLKVSRAPGNAEERAYIGALLFHGKKDIGLRISKETIAKNLRGNARSTFDGKLDDAIKGMPKHVCRPKAPVRRAIFKAWATAKLRIGDPPADLTLLEAVRRTHLSYVERSKLVSGLRFEMAKVIAKNLDPGLVILDEFQNYRDLLRMDEQGRLTHEVMRSLLKPEVKTLLLSATPFPSFVSTQDAMEAGAHAEKLQETLLFLSGSPQEAGTIANQLVKYAGKIESLKDDAGLKELVAIKADIEATMKKFIVRTERVLLEGRESALVETRQLTQQSPVRIPDDEMVHAWFAFRNKVDSPRTYLSLWRSGQSPMSYLAEKDQYRSLAGATGDKALQADVRLYAKPGREPFQPKLAYLWEELLNRGACKDYLWLPPLRPYYQGEGVYSSEAVATARPKKGLVFSAWSFVPRMIAAELSAAAARGPSEEVSNNPVKPGLSAWARFWHPSLFLAEALTHRDLASHAGKEYKQLADLAKARILDKLGWDQPKGNAGLPWQVLAQADLGKEEEGYRKAVMNSLKNRSRFRGSREEEEPGPVLQEGMREKIKECAQSQEHRLSKACLEELAEICLTSPSVCLLRALIALGVFNAKRPLPEEFEIVADFCARQWKAFFNRKNVRGIIKKNGGHGPYPKRLQNYLRAGNIQAVLDEYLFLVAGNSVGSDPKALVKILTRMKQALARRQSKLEVRQPIGKDSRQVVTDMVKAFDQADDESDTRESIREAFNSPFWPFVLATTSVGQEGLDFHLYCRDVYHWNLPSNPVAFEQREGRINRFNALWVRQAVSAATPGALEPGTQLWKDLFARALEKAHVMDRLSLGLSPHWTFSSTGNCGQGRGYTRHVLSLSGSEEQLRYERLMDNLELYRLTLGQPNQARFLERLNRNKFLKGLPNRKGIMICLFPSDYRIHQRTLLRQYRSRNDNFASLFRDVKERLEMLRSLDVERELCDLVEKNKDNLRKHETLKDKLKHAKALINFVDPFDEVHDWVPGTGWDDDIEKLRQALK